MNICQFSGGEAHFANGNRVITRGQTGEREISCRVSDGFNVTRYTWCRRLDLGGRYRRSGAIDDRAVNSSRVFTGIASILRASSSSEIGVGSFEFRALFMV